MYVFTPITNTLLTRAMRGAFSQRQDNAGRNPSNHSGDIQVLKVSRNPAYRFANGCAQVTPSDWDPVSSY